MQCRTIPRNVAVFLLGVAVATASTAAMGAPSTEKPIPTLSELRQVVVSYFRALPNYRPNDLLTRDIVKPLLVQIEQEGLPLPDAKEILERVPAKDEFLPEQLATPEGQAFMRQVSRFPNAYARLDRLARMPHGQQTIRDLIHGPDGWKMIEYLTTAPGGKQMGDQLSNSPTGRDFNADTGRIYTGDMLWARLQKSYAAAMKKAESAKPQAAVSNP